MNPAPVLHANDKRIEISVEKGEPVTIIAAMNATLEMTEDQFLLDMVAVEVETLAHAGMTFVPAGDFISTREGEVKHEQQVTTANISVVCGISGNK